jgi:hypothetical protein
MTTSSGLPFVGIKYDDPVVCARGLVLLSFGTANPAGEFIDEACESGVPTPCCPVSTTDMPRIRGDPGLKFPTSSTEGGNTKLGVEEFDGGRFAGALCTETGDGGSIVGGNFPSFTK